MSESRFFLKKQIRKVRKKNALKTLLNRQRKLGEAIDVSEKKFAKTGTAVRKEKYFRKRITEMNQWWAEFGGNHNVILTNQEECNEKKAYLTEKYYDAIKLRRDKIMELYLNAANRMYPEAEFTEVTESNENGSDDDEDPEDDLNAEEFKRKSVMETMHSTGLFEAVRQVQKKKSAEKLFEVRATALQDATEKLLIKHEEPTTEVELEFDLKKLENLLTTYTLAYEERIMVANNDGEIEALRIENEDLTNTAERAIVSFQKKRPTSDIKETLNQRRRNYNR